MKMKGRPILVGVDDSEPSRDAAVLGFRVARAAASPLHLVTATLDALAEVTAARLGLDLPLFVSGPRSARIARVLVAVDLSFAAAIAVRRGPAALLVLGTHGSGWVDRLLLGSTTEELLARLPSSLVIVPCVRHDGEVAS